MRPTEDTCARRLAAPRLQRVLDRNTDELAQLGDAMFGDQGKALGCVTHDRKSVLPMAGSRGQYFEFNGLPSGCRCAVTALNDCHDQQESSSSRVRVDCSKCTGHPHPRPLPRKNVGGYRIGLSTGAYDGPLNTCG